MKTLIKNANIFDSKSCKFGSGSLIITDDKISQINYEMQNYSGGFDKVIDADNMLLIPGFYDMHTHGREGFDFAGANAEQMQIMSQSYLNSGVTSVMPTLASAPLDKLFTASDTINGVKGQEKGARFVGVHLEGRYINPQKRGAHAPQLLEPLNPDEMEELVVRMRLPCRISAAFELDNSGEFMARAKSLGVTLGLAHTTANYEEALDIYRRGNVGFAHLYNAMPQIHHRDGGAVCVALLQKAYSELICDGMHIAPHMIKLAHSMLGDDKVVLITDSMEATHCKDGEYNIAGMPVTVKNSVARTHDGALAGSTLSFVDAINNYMDFCEIPLERAINAATLNPAKMTGVDSIIGSLEVGKYADILLAQYNNGKLKLNSVIKGGGVFELE